MVSVKGRPVSSSVSLVIQTRRRVSQCAMYFPYGQAGSRPISRPAAFRTMLGTAKSTIAPSKGKLSANPRGMRFQSIAMGSGLYQLEQARKYSYDHRRPLLAKLRKINCVSSPAYSPIRLVVNNL